MSPIISRLRRPRTALALAAGLVIAGAGIGQAAVGDVQPPPPKPLDVALHDALNAPEVPGLTAHITFRNNLLPSGTLPKGAGSPLLSGADGRVWLAGDGRLRLELQSSAGDAQVVSDGKTLSYYDAAQNTAVRMAVPAQGDHAKDGPGDATDHSGPDEHGPPTLADVRKGLEQLAQKATLSGAQPRSLAGRPAYEVSVSPQHDGGLLGAASLAWDAERGVPLRAALTAQGQQDPVLSLEATDISYEPIPASTFAVGPPAGAKITELDRAQVEQKAKRHHGSDRKGKDVQGLDAVRAAVPFELAAPKQLVGLDRREVRLIDGPDGHRGAAVIYGQGLGALAVIQQPAAPAKPGDRRERDFTANLPKVSIEGATASELSTALGTALRFDRHGVSTTVVGSLPATAAEAAARELP